MTENFPVFHIETDWAPKTSKQDDDGDDDDDDDNNDKECSHRAQTDKINFSHEARAQLDQEPAIHEIDWRCSGLRQVSQTNLQ